MATLDATCPMPVERPVFAARSRRRPLALRAVGIALATLASLWLVALALGTTGFRALPAAPSVAVGARPLTTAAAAKPPTRVARHRLASVRTVAHRFVSARARAHPTST